MAFLTGDLVVVRVTTSSATASFRDITQQVDDFPGFVLEAITEDAHTFGDAWAETAFTGMRRLPAFTFGGPYDDDTSTGVRGIFFGTTDPGAERVMKINVGTTNAYPKFDFIVQSAQIMPRLAGRTHYEVAIQPTGALTIVTT